MAGQAKAVASSGLSRYHHAPGNMAVLPTIRQSDDIKGARECQTTVPVALDQSALYLYNRNVKPKPMHTTRLRPTSLLFAVAAIVSVIASSIATINGLAYVTG